MAIFDQKECIGGRQGHTAERTIGQLPRSESLRSTGVAMEEVVRQAGISEGAQSRWRKGFGGSTVDQTKPLKELEQENTGVAESGCQSDDMRFRKTQASRTLSGFDSLWVFLLPLLGTMLCGSVHQSWAADSPKSTTNGFRVEFLALRPPSLRESVLCGAHTFLSFSCPTDQYSLIDPCDTVEGCANSPS